ncbi:hypothetical protein [Roseovarius rhodophyticola]|uniref:Uncharacterized protein n=1 Tax=Roseovarius rhodophyticola TaxID=3080827 RepID=A0ABZ2TKM4_9RHOB|nr:hypothetical protein [Roseovarius sp. W115]MDV2927922.1 hypothetical protein [Roseovarius sp. W115]
MPKGDNISGKLGSATVILNVPVRPRNTRPTGKNPKRLHARAINRILDKETGDLVGWLYEWNTGERVPRWKASAVSDVIYD